MHRKRCLYISTDFHNEFLGCLECNLNLQLLIVNHFKWPGRDWDNSMLYDYVSLILFPCKAENILVKMAEGLIIQNCCDQHNLASAEQEMQSILFSCNMILCVLHAETELGMENQGNPSLPLSSFYLFSSVSQTPPKLKIYLFPERSRSNPSFIFSSGKTWVIN